jgi:hypothetical protein
MERDKVSNIKNHIAILLADFLQSSFSKLMHHSALSLLPPFPAPTRQLLDK